MTPLAPLGRLLVLLLFAIGMVPGQAAPPPASIRVVLDDNYPPYSFRDSSGHVQGILKDLWGLWEQRTGVTVDFRPMDWGKARAIMENGQADVIDTIFETEERRKIYDFSRPYATIEVPIFFHRSIGGIIDATSLRGFTVGVKDGDTCVDYLKAHGIANLKRYPSYEAEVKAAIRHEIRVLCIDDPPAYYFFNREGAIDEFRHSPPLYVGEFHWAVAKGRTDLKHLVEEGFARITAGERAAIEARWLGEKLTRGLWSGVARYGGYVLLAVALVMAILIAWSWTLRRRVAARTAELATADNSLRESEARFRSLTEMSSDWYWEQDKDFRFTLMSGGIMNKGNFAVKNALGKTRWEMPIELGEAEWAAHRATLEAHRAFTDFEYRIVTNDGSARYYSARGEPLFDADWEFSGYRGIANDITESRRHDEDLRRFRAAMDATEDGIYLVDRASMRFVDVNEAACRRQGCTREALLALGPEGVLSVPREELERAYDAIIAGDAHTAVFERLRTRKDGAPIWLEVQRSAHRSDNGWTIVTVARDITERKEAEHRIAYLNRVYAMLSGINTLIVRVRDRDELFKEACRIALEAGEFRMAWMGIVDRGAMKIFLVASAGMDEELLAYINDRLSLNESASLGNRIIVQAITEREAVVVNDVQTKPALVLRKKFAESGVHSMAMLPLIVSDETVGVLALYSGEVEFFHEEELKLLKALAGDIAFAIDNIEKRERLDYLAYYDALTGLANRSLFLERVAQHLRSAISSGHKLAVYLVDLERFKNINDSLGRPAGDALLRQVAQWLTQIAGDASLLARVSADHFAAVLPEVKQGGDVGRLLEKWMESFVQHPFHLNDAVFRVAIKVGVALFPDDGGDAETLFRNAEAALKKAKASGERYLFYTQKMTETVAGKLTLENQLRQALDNEEFVLHYQPKVDLASGKLTGAEALIRWNDPRAGLVPPGRFIPVLEETGLIYDVGRWALHKAIEDYLRWRAAGLAAVRIAVNVSPLQLRNRGFIAEIEQVISVDAQAAEGLELEITESLIMEDVKHNIASLQAIRDLGVTIAIDDFGTGFSSLSYLAKLPVDTLKIDRSFVIDMTAGPQGLALVSTIISLAHSLKLKVVAEGVETEEQSRLLRLLACDEMQGFLFSKPVPAEIFESRFLAPALALAPAG